MVKPGKGEGDTRRGRNRAGVFTIGFLLFGGKLREEGGNNN